MLRPTAMRVYPEPDRFLKVEFDNGEIKRFDVKPYIKGSWYGQLSDEKYFQMVSTDGFTVFWPEGQDLCPDELYELSESL